MCLLGTLGHSRSLWVVLDHFEEGFGTFFGLRKTKKRPFFARKRLFSSVFWLQRLQKHRSDPQRRVDWPSQITFQSIFNHFEAKFHAFVWKNDLVFHFLWSKIFKFWTGLVPKSLRKWLSRSIKLPKHPRTIANHPGTQKSDCFGVQRPKNGLVFHFFSQIFMSNFGPQVHQTYFGPSKGGSQTPQVHPCQVWTHLVQ